MDFSQPKLRRQSFSVNAEGALPTGPITHDDFISTVSASNLDGLFCNAEKGL